jgi:hypothetical protein
MTTSKGKADGDCWLDVARPCQQPFLLFVLRRSCHSSLGRCRVTQPRSRPKVSTNTPPRDCRRSFVERAQILFHQVAFGDFWSDAKVPLRASKLSTFSLTVQRRLWREETPTARDCCRR